MDHEKADIHGLVMVFRMIRRSLNYFAKKYDLSLTEMGIVFDTFFHGQVTVTELSESQGIPKSTVSRLVENLVQRGYLNRVRPEDNRRIVQITITDSYRAELDALTSDDGFQRILEQDIPREKGRQAIGKLNELLALLQDPEGTDPA